MSTSIDEIKKVLERERAAREADKAEILQALRESRDESSFDPKGKLKTYFSEDGADPKAVRERRRNKKESDENDD